MKRSWRDKEVNVKGRRGSQADVIDRHTFLSIEVEKDLVMEMDGEG